MVKEKRMPKEESRSSGEDDIIKIISSWVHDVVLIQNRCTLILIIFVIKNCNGNNRDNGRVRPNRRNCNRRRSNHNHCRIDTKAEAI